MAYVADDPNKLQDPNQQQQAQGTAQQTGPAQPTLSGGAGGGDVVSGGGQPSSQTAQAGSGGAGGSWTNIQNYMQANQGGTGSSKILQDQVGGQFNQEKSQLDTQSTQALDPAQKAAQKAQDASSNASQWLSQAGTDYNYGGNGDNSAYQQDMGKFKDALNNKYSGPSSFAYGLGTDTQKYGQALQDDGGFHNFLGDLYQQRAGGPLSTGQMALQNQFDANDQSLVDTRTKLLQQYSGLGDYVNQKVQDTNSGLSNAEQTYRTSQNAFTDYLNKQNNDLNSDIGKKESDAKFEYENAYNNDKTNDALAISHDPFHNFRYDDKDNEGSRYNFANNNPLALTHHQLQQEQDVGLAPKWADSERAKQYFAQNAQHLNDWYGEQDAKYAGTGDTEKRQWNAIQDILNSTADRKQQGFKVRG